MRRTQVLQEMQKMRFEEAYEGWNAGRLTQARAVAEDMLRDDPEQSAVHLKRCLTSRDELLKT